MDKSSSPSKPSRPVWHLCIHTSLHVMLHAPCFQAPLQPAAHPVSSPCWCHRAALPLHAASVMLSGAPWEAPAVRVAATITLSCACHLLLPTAGRLQLGPGLLPPSWQGPSGDVGSAGSNRESRPRELGAQAAGWGGLPCPVPCCQAGARLQDGGSGKGCYQLACKQVQQPYRVRRGMPTLHAKAEFGSHIHASLTRKSVQVCAQHMHHIDVSCALALAGLLLPLWVVMVAQQRQGGAASAGVRELVPHSFQRPADVAAHRAQCAHAEPTRAT
jgi:hypothetical protein